MTDAPALKTARFGTLDVAYNEDVLEPRAWTAAQSEWAAELLTDAPAGPVLELCAGVGHIGLLAVADSDRRLVLVDLNPVASELSSINAEAAGASERVEIRTGSMLDVVEPGERFPIIIADPPWVASDAIGTFPEDPQIAIDGGADGLDLARMCCSVIDAHLADGGSAVLQVGSQQQVDAVADHLAATSTTSLRVVEVRAFERGVLALVAR
jgi:methylase of polypeptide subunit release factors